MLCQLTVRRDDEKPDGALSTLYYLLDHAKINHCNILDTLFENNSDLVKNMTAAMVCQILTTRSGETCTALKLFVFEQNIRSFLFLSNNNVQFANELANKADFDEIFVGQAMSKSNFEKLNMGPENIKTTKMTLIQLLTCHSGGIEALAILIRHNPALVKKIPDTDDLVALLAQNPWLSDILENEHMRRQIETLAVKVEKAVPAPTPDKPTTNASTGGLFSKAPEEESALIKALREYINEGNQSCANILDVFIVKKTNKPIKDPQYPAALRKACKSKDDKQSLELVKILLAHVDHADLKVNAVNSQGQSAVNYAEKNNNAEVLALLNKINNLTVAPARSTEEKRL